MLVCKFSSQCGQKGEHHWRAASSAVEGGSQLVHDMLQSRWRKSLVGGKPSQEPLIFRCSQRIPRWRSSHLRWTWWWRAQCGHIQRTIHSLFILVFPMVALGWSPFFSSSCWPGQLRMRKTNPVSEYLGVQFITETITEDLRQLAWLKITVCVRRGGWPSHSFLSQLTSGC